MKKRLISALVVLFAITSLPAQQITRAEYFFNTDPGQGLATALSVTAADSVIITNNISIPANLSAGINLLFVRVGNNNGTWSFPEVNLLWINTAAKKINSLEYFFDTDPGVGNGTRVNFSIADSINLVQNVIVPDSLRGGSHILFVRVQNQGGSWSMPETYLISVENGFLHISGAEYFFDTDPGIGSATPLTIGTAADSVILIQNITIPALSTGIHSLYVRVKNTKGSWSFAEVDTLSITSPVSTITCPANATVNTIAGQCVAVVNNIDPSINPPQSYTYSLSGATTASGNGSASGQTFNAGVTIVTYTLVSSPTCSFTVTVNALPPNISNQPTSQAVCTGSNVTFSVTASGSGLTYQWRKNTANIPGATSSSYAITGATTGDAGNYDVIVTSSCNAGITSAEATLTVNIGASITSQPLSQAVCTGSNVTFSVTASGTGLTYQWRKSTVNIPGATSSSYTITGATAGDAGSYDVVVTGSCGTITSNAATLTVNAATTIGTQPASQTICAGSNVTFSVTASGASLTYQWRKNAVNIPGAISSSYTITGATTGDAGSYDAVVTGTCGTATSNTASLTVNPVTAISTQPASQTICAGSNVTFSVTATGTGLTYQWRKNTVNIPAATSPSYTITSATAGDAGNYDAIVTGTCGTVTSNTASLTVNPVTTISTQPTSQTVCPGNNVTFSVTASGTSITYQWRKNTLNIPGATSSSYIITGATAGDAGNYDAIVTGTCGIVTSNAAGLTVNAVTTIGAQPTSQTICAGSNVTFNVTASGASLTYQWRKNTLNIPGATSSSYTITGATAGDAGNYDVVTTGTCGVLVSTAAILTVNTNAAIATQPASQTICAGGNVTFSVIATGSSLTYQWRKNSVSIAGATSSSYTITGIATSDAGSYDVIVVSGSCAPPSISNAATLTVNPLPLFTLGNFPSLVCTSDSAFTLTASLAGGTWSGTGVQGNKFFPSVGGAGSFTITYTVTNSFGCTNSVSTTIPVKECDERHRTLDTKDAVIIYPNPNMGKFSIKMNSDLYDKLGMRVYSSDGKLVKTQEFSGLIYGSIIPVDLQYMAGGVYLLYLYNNSGQLIHNTFKIVIAR